MIKNATEVLKQFMIHQQELARSKELGATGITFQVDFLKKDIDELVAFLEQAEGLELLALIRHHDWYYMMSDDHRVFRKGEDANRLLRHRFKNAVDQDLAKVIWKRNAPEGTAFPCT